MSLFSGLRLLVYLRRLAIAQERLADIETERLQHERIAWQNAIPRRARPTEFASFDAGAANAQWLAEQEAAEFGGVPEEPTPK